MTKRQTVEQRCDAARAAFTTAESDWAKAKAQVDQHQAKAREAVEALQAATQRLNEARQEKSAIERELRQAARDARIRR